MAKYKTKSVNISREVRFKAHKHYSSKDIQEITLNLVQMVTRHSKQITDVDKIDLNKIEKQLRIYEVIAKRRATKLEELKEEELTGLRKNASQDTRDAVIEKWDNRIRSVIETAVRIKQLHHEIYSPEEGDTFFLDKVTAYLKGMGLTPIRDGVEIAQEDQDKINDEPTTDDAMI